MNENQKGPAEAILGTLLQNTDHLMHGRTGVVKQDPSSPLKVKWEPVVRRKNEEGVDEIFTPKNRKAAIGTRRADGVIVSTTGGVLGTWQPSGLFVPAVVWLWKQIAEVYKMDSEFVARWASWSFAKENKDMKVALAAFLLVQPRSGRPLMADGKPVKDADGKPIVVEEDDRAVGEAMLLLRRTDKNDLNPKLILRVAEILELPEIAALNRELGFGGGGKHPFMGRYPATVSTWLKSRETNPKLLEGAVKAGFRNTIRRLAQKVRYKPETPAFFRILRWKQAQSEAGHRTLAIGVEVEKAETWEGLTEGEVCLRISQQKPAYKRLVSLVPTSVGMTPAVLACAMESGCFSDADLVIATPTLEDAGLLKIPAIRARWEKATAATTNQRARNIAKNVKDVEVKAVLDTAADTAAAKQIAEDMRGLHIRVVVDISGSMQESIAQAKVLVATLLTGIPTSKIRISVFNTACRELMIPKALGTKDGVLDRAVGRAVLDAMFAGIQANGGTMHRIGVQVLRQNETAPKDEDILYLFVGDEGENGPQALAAELQAVTNLVGIGLLKVAGQNGTIVQDAAKLLGLPLIRIEPATLVGDDPYRIPGILRALLRAAPTQQAYTVNVAPVRKSLVEEILAVSRLEKPAWA